MKTIKSIYYHNPTPAQLERTIAWLQRKGYRFLTIDELFDYASGNRPIDGRLAYLSFDDAWRSNLELIPVIEQHAVPITIFAPVEPIESGNYWWEYMPREQRERFKTLDYQEFTARMAELKARQSLQRSCMTADELRSIARHPLVSVQSHTLTHPILTSLPDDIMRREIVESKARLEAIIGKRVDYFSYPNGTYTMREVEAARSAYKMAFTTDLRYISVGDDLLALPRIEVTGRYWRDKLKFYNIWPIIKKICLSD